MKKGINLMRNLRLRYKTGYMVEESAEYQFMKRYPPLSRDTAPPLRRIEKDKLPYLRLYNEAVAKNPLYMDERVYPAYWQQEPTAIVLAKKWYEFMEVDGMPEKEAYDKAVAHVEELESKSYEQFVTMYEEIKSRKANMWFENDPNISRKIQHWNSILQAAPYEKLSDSDQGEIDNFIQVDILKWTEIQRDRRMKDPVFVVQFNKFRDALLPGVAIGRLKLFKDNVPEMKEKICVLYDINLAKFKTSNPFYVEDYLKYFKLCKAQPILANWKESEMQEYSRWIVDTLAIKDILDKKKQIQHKQQYLNDLRAVFFPMLKNPSKVDTLNLPTIDKIKQVLYENKIGYKVDEATGKLFVLRAYRIPLLFFPVETLAVTIASNKDRSISVTSDDGMSDEISSAGLNEQTEAVLKQQINDMITVNKAMQMSSSHNKSSMSNMSNSSISSSNSNSSGSSSSGSSNVNIGTFDGVFRDESLDEEDRSFNDRKNRGNNSNAAASDPSLLANAMQLAHIDEIDPEFNKYLLNSVNKQSTRGRMNLDEAPDDIPEYTFDDELFKQADPVGFQAKMLALKQYKQPATVLEKERHRIFSMTEICRIEDVTTEEELNDFKRNRLENELITRARLNVDYERKEAALRIKQWKDKGLWVDDDFPRPPLVLR